LKVCVTRFTHALELKTGKTSTTGIPANILAIFQFLFAEIPLKYFKRNEVTTIWQLAKRYIIQT